MYVTHECVCHLQLRSKKVSLAHVNVAASNFCNNRSKLPHTGFPRLVAGETVRTSGRTKLACLAVYRICEFVTEFLYTAVSDGWERA